MSPSYVTKAAKDVAVDVALGAAVTLVVAVAISADLGDGRGPDVVAYLFAVGLGLLMLVRRQHPVLALVATAVGILGYYAAEYPPVGLAIPAAAALFSAAEHGHLRIGVATSGALLVISSAARLREGTDPAYLFGYEFASTVGLMAAALALGELVRTRRLWHEEQGRREALMLAEQEREAARRVEHERVRIARDVHDILAHTVTVVSLQADVASEALDDDLPAVRSALENIRAVSRDANRELRAALAVLRRPADQPALVPTGGLHDLGRLVESVAESGPTVELRVHGEPGTLSAVIDTTAYRIVQEALTNALRHARADRIDIEVTHLPDRLELRVTDDGVGGDTDTGGQGLAGMRERAALLGGTLKAGNRETGGFAVTASIPTGEAR